MRFVAGDARGGAPVQFDDLIVFIAGRVLKRGRRHAAWVLVLAATAHRDAGDQAGLIEACDVV